MVRKAGTVRSRRLAFSGKRLLSASKSLHSQAVTFINVLLAIEPLPPQIMVKMQENKFYIRKQALALVSKAQLAIIKGANCNLNSPSRECC